MYSFTLTGLSTDESLYYEIPQLMSFSQQRINQSVGPLSSTRKRRLEDDGLLDGSPSYSSLISPAPSSHSSSSSGLLDSEPEVYNGTLHRQGDMVSVKPVRNL